MGGILYQEQEPSIKSHVSCKYGSLDLYDKDVKKRFIIDHKQLQYDKTDGCTLIGITEKEDGTFSDH